MKQAQRLVKNFVVGVMGQVIGAGLNIATTIVIARYLGVSGFGHYAFVMALVGVFQLISDLGLKNILIREIAMDKEHVGKWLGVAKSLIWPLSIVAFSLIVVAINVIRPPQEVLYSTYIAGLAAIATFHAVIYGSVCRAFEDMEFNALGYVLRIAFFFILASIGVWMDSGLLGIFIAFLISNLSLWLYYYIIVRKKYVRPSLSIDMRAWRSLIKEAFPLGIALILRGVSWQVDILMLTAMASPVAVGLFNTAYRVIRAINRLPRTLANPFFPVYSRLAKRSSESLFAAYEKSVKFLCIVALPVVVGIAVLSERMITLFFGAEFSPAASALQIQSLAIILLFQTSLFIHLFTAMGKQRLYTISSGACLGINVLLDIVLIPRYSYVGACIGTLVGEITLFSMGLYFLRRLGSRVSLMNVTWKPLIASIILGVFLYLVKEAPLPWVVSGIVGGALLYGITILSLRTFSPAEIYLIREGLSFMHRSSISKRADF